MDRCEHCGREYRFELMPRKDWVRLLWVATMIALGAGLIAIGRPWEAWLILILGLWR